MRARVACLDVGTSAAKGAVFEGAKVVVRVTAPLPPPEGPGNLREQPLAAVDKACADALAALAKAAPPGRWDALAITTQRGTLLFVDKKGEPLGELASWLDRRGDRWQWLRRERPDVAARVAGFRSLQSWLAERLGGRAVDTAQTAPPEAACLAKDGVAGPALEASGFLSTTKGPLAARLGLPAELPLVLSGGDKNAEMLGAGALASGTAVLSFGTAVSLGVIHRGAPPDGPVFVTPGAVDGSVHVEVGVPFGGALRDWARGVLRVEREMPLPELPPEGLLFLPYLGGSLPRPDATGTILGLTPRTRPEDIAAAAIAGILLELRRARAELTLPFSRVVLCGGGASDPRLAAWAAGALGVPVDVFVDGSRGLAGAAMLAARARGRDDWEAPSRTPPARTVEATTAEKAAWERRGEAFTQAVAAMAKGPALP